MARNYNLDLIRGIAVLGLVYLNIYTFGIFEVGYVSDFPKVASDDFIVFINSFFLEGRFRTLFSLLFGVGLALQWRKKQPLSAMKQRLKWLALFGLIHGFLLWAGDILLAYSLAGLYIIKYLDDSAEQLLSRAMRYIAVSSLVLFLISFGAGGDTLNRQSEEFLSLYNSNFTDFFAIFKQNLIMNLFMLVIVPLSTLWLSAGLMLFGIYLYKNNIFSHALKRKHVLYCFIAAIFFSTALFLISVYGSTNLQAFKDLLVTLSSLCTALIYIHFAVKFCQSSQYKGRLLQHVGRLAFTLYIMQTLLQLLLFKYLFVHWVLTFNRIDYFIVATLIVIFQLIFAACYFKFFKQGPLEAGWRKLIKL